MEFGGFSIFDIAVLATIFLGALFGLTFARLYLLPTQPNVMPEQVCMQPAW